jgi:DNA-binding transcriptional regulator of glucitol operon
MYATEFKTVINQPYIQIPNYENFKGKSVRIILLDVEEDIKIEEEPRKVNFFERITKNPQNIKDIDFLSRDEANER